AVVTANRHGADAPFGKCRLGSIHDIDVFREENDLSNRPRQLRGVVSSKSGLRLTDLAHHRKHIDTRGRGLRVLKFLCAHHTHDGLIAEVSPQSTCLNDAESVEQLVSELL